MRHLFHVLQVLNGHATGPVAAARGVSVAEVVGGGPRNHHDLVIVVSGLELAGPEVHPVPVPAALWLLGSGLLALFGLLRRRA